MHKVLIVVTLICLCTLSYGAWEAIGPAGGNIRSVVVSPSNENILYAASYSYPCKIFRSIDAGASWTRTGSYNGYNYCMAIDPSDNLYSGYYGRVWKSTDGGATWTSGTVTSVYVYGLAVHPTDPSIIVGAGRKYISSGVYDMVFIKSTNSGSTWTTTTVLNTGGYCYGWCVAIDPSSPNTIYVGGSERISTTYYPRVYKSTDGGSNFTDVTWAATTGYYTYSLAVHPTNSNIVYAGTYTDGIYRSTDNGGSWTKVSTYFYNYRMATSSLDPNLVFSSGYSSVYRSTDAGLTWTSFSSGLDGSYLWGLAISPVSTSNVYVGNNAGCYKSTTMGTTWAAAINGMYLGEINDIGLAPSSPATLYTEFENVGVYKTIDNGSSWDLLPTPSTCGALCAFGVHNTDPDIVFGFEGSG